jgi:hypothetical protein
LSRTTLDATLERLARAGFQFLPTPQIPNHYVIERDGFVALIESRADGCFGAAGAPGLLQEDALAMLVWKADGPTFVAKGRETPASPEQVEALRNFDRDLRRALDSAATATSLP